MRGQGSRSLRTKRINPSTMGSHGKKILQQALRCRRQHFWKSPWSAKVTPPGADQAAARFSPLPGPKPSAPMFLCPLWEVWELERLKPLHPGPGHPWKNAQDRRAPKCPLQPRVLLGRLTTELPLTPASLFPAAPRPLQHCLISGTGGRPGPGSQLSRAGAQQGETHYMGLTGFKRR